MKKIFLLTLVLSSTLFSQTNTEVHVFYIVKTAGKIDLKNGINISNNIDYDSQPSFYDDTTVLFASTVKGETDIALYDLKQKRPNLYYISVTENGTAHSPQRRPKSNTISAVRLAKNCLQHFCSSTYKTKK
jgi:hypothetical protein